MRFLVLICFLLAYVPAFGENQSDPANTVSPAAKPTHTSQKSVMPAAKPDTTRPAKAEASVKRAPRSPSTQSDADVLLYCASGCGG